jgi:hypothetical protein
LLVFTHRSERAPDAPADEPSPADQVRAEAERVLGTRSRAYSRVAEDSAAPLATGTELRIVPSADGLRFNPPQALLDWTGEVLTAHFQVRADAAMDGETARGDIAIWAGPLLLAEMALVIRVSAAEAEEAERAGVEESAAPYRRVFASYSHRDEPIVAQMEAYARAFGDEYLRDVTRLRSGEYWDARILDMIEQADVFQLFWSWNAMQSEYVQREWQHALSLGRARFIRPVYWEDPLPESADAGLPTDELRALHFQKLPFSSHTSGTRRDAATKSVSMPAPASSPSRTAPVSARRRNLFSPRLVGAAATRRIWVTRG